MLPAETLGAELSMRVAYVTTAALPHESVVVTEMIAEHVPEVEAVLTMGPGQSSLAVVAAMAFASANGTFW